jgi:hypothetical protein
MILANLSRGLPAANSTRLRTSGHTCVRPIECSVTTTMWSTLAWNEPLPTQGGSHQSAREAGQPSVKIREDSYKFSARGPKLAKNGSNHVPASKPR